MNYWQNGSIVWRAERAIRCATAHRSPPPPLPAVCVSTWLWRGERAKSSHLTRRWGLVQRLAGTALMDDTLDGSSIYQPVHRLIAPLRGAKPTASVRPAKNSQSADRTIAECQQKGRIAIWKGALSESQPNGSHCCSTLTLSYQARRRRSAGRAHRGMA